MTIARSQIVEGLDELIGKLNGLSAALQTKALRTPLKRGAELVLGSAKAKAPYRSGDLRNSMRVSTKSSKKKGTVGAQVKDGVFYGRIVEHGYIAQNGKHIPAKAFMLPAFEEKQGEVIGVVSDALTKQLAKMKKKGKI